jgi:hypothetical protein
MADVEFDQFEGGYDSSSKVAKVQRVVNMAGGITSVVLVAGLAFWGYKVAVRDVTGIPVVQALEGPMRIAPDDPGGSIAAHQGLSVNAVAAVGTALPPPEQLVLAPRPVELTLEDAPGLATPVVAAPAPEAEPLVTATEATEGEGTAVADTATDAPAPGALDPTATELALAEALADGAEPLTPLADATELAALEPAAPPPGALTRSLRPQPRPASVAAAAPQAEGERPTQLAELSAATAAPVTEIDPATLTAGTRLVQLGAFDDAEAARAEWVKLNGRFTGLLEGKARVVQAAQSGGRTFYRLRVHGFDDVADAGRFCSALVAENAACIPVAVR